MNGTDANVSKYRVYRRDGSSGSWQLLGEVQTPYNYYTDSSTLQYGTPYTYGVSANSSYYGEGPIVTIGVTTWSAADRWLAATMAGPSRGTNCRPVTAGRKYPRSNG